MNANDPTRSTNPFPGLRPFLEDEEHLFFGREKQVDAMVNKLAAKHFLAVVGTSGSGKSSLVNCGLRPALHRGWMPNAGTAWRVAQFRPGSNAIHALAEALSSDGVLYRDFKAQGISLSAILESELRTSNLGLVKAFEHARLGPNVNLLVVADQFEELFRYYKAGSARGASSQGLDEDAKAFVNLLLAVREHTALRLYVVLTMRSDFLGDCAGLLGLPEAINEGQYLVPRMNRDERRLAIAGPVGVGKAKIDPALEMRLVNDVGDNPDQLSILQHALNRTWALWERQDPPRGPLTLDHYERVGTMAHALDQHAERAFAELDSERKRQICASVMKALTDWGTDARGTRRPTTLGTLCALANATASEVTDVLDVFRKPSRSFLMPPSSEALTDETPIDISHESLMRVWERLKTWGEEEARSVQMYRRLLDWARRWEKGDAELWRGPDLSSASAWRVNEVPTPPWAERYGSRDDFQVVMKFLDTSEAAQHVSAAAAEAARRFQLRRARRWAWGFGLATLALLAGLLGYFAAYRWDRDTYFNSYVMVRGVPHGIGPLSADQVRHRSKTYRITTKGRIGEVIRMEAVNASGQLANGNKPTGFEQRSDEPETGEARWEYVYGADGQVAYEVALDRTGQRVRSIVYSPVDQKSPDSRNSYMIGKLGSVAPHVGSCAAFLRYEYSDEGFEIKTHYINQIGNPTVGRDGIYILAKKFDSQGRELSMLSLWKDQRPMNDNMGNADMRFSYDDMGNMIAAAAFDAAGAPINLKGDYPDKWQRMNIKYDTNGNVVETIYWDANGRPGMQGEGCHRIRNDYDEVGQIIRSTCLDPEGKTTLADGQKFTTWETSYDDTGRRSSLKFYDAAWQPAKGTEGAFLVKIAYDQNNNITEISYFGADGQPVVGNWGFHKRTSKFDGGREVRTDYLDVGGKPFAISNGYVAIERKFDDRGNLEVTNYLDAGGSLVRVQGFASSRKTYDACGRETEVRYFDEKGGPIKSSEGMAGIRKVYDEDGNVVEESRLDESGQLIQSPKMYARVERKFDRHRNVVQEEYFDVLGAAWMKNGHFAKITRQYDDHNALVEVAYFDASGKPTSGDERAARVVYGLGPYGQRMETYFDVNNALIKSKAKFADLLPSFDDKKMLIEELHVGTGGQPVLKDETVYFGPTGKPIKSERDFARMTKQYDDRKNLIVEEYFGVDGKPMAKRETVYFGGDGKLVKSEQEYSKLTQRFDSNNSLVEEAYFGSDGEPFLKGDGWSRVTYVRDKLGRDIERAYFGVHGEPVIERTQRFHRGKRVLDDRENMLELETFGTDGKPLVLKWSDGTRSCARRVWRYDAKNKQVGEVCFDAAGRIVY